MAFETEEIVLDPEIIKLSFNRLINNPSIGYYSVALEENEQTNSIHFYKGMNLVFYEFNILTNKISFWLQSVMVKKDQRKKGVFKSIVNFTEGLIMKNLERNNNKIKLYVYGDNENAQKVYLNLGFSPMRDYFYDRDFVADEPNWDVFNSKYPKTNRENDVNFLEIIDMNHKDIYSEANLNEICFLDFSKTEEYSTINPKEKGIYKNIFFIFLRSK